MTAQFLSTPENKSETTTTTLTTTATTYNISTTNGWRAEINTNKYTNISIAGNKIFILTPNPWVHRIEASIEWKVEEGRKKNSPEERIRRNRYRLFRGQSQNQTNLVSAFLDLIILGACDGFRLRWCILMEIFIWSLDFIYNLVYLCGSIFLCCFALVAAADAGS